MVNLNEIGFSFDFYILGEGFLIFAQLTNTFGTFLANELTNEIHTFLVTAWQMFLGSTTLLLLGLPELQADAIVFTTKAWILLFYSSFLSATTFALWYSILKYNKAGEITLYKFVIPVSGAILSAIFIPGESFTVNIIWALVLVSIGIIVINYKKVEKPCSYI